MVGFPLGFLANDCLHMDGSPPPWPLSPNEHGAGCWVHGRSSQRIVSFN